MNTQLFLSLNSWNDFEKALLSLNKKEKGNAFEQLTKFYFQLDPAHKTYYDEVWLFSEVPTKHLEKLGLPAQDLGIDLIARVGEEYHAIQCKYHTDNNTAVTFKEVATFLSLFESNSKITKGYICSSADLTSKNLDKVRSEHITLVLSDTWNNLSKEFFDAIKAELQHKKIELVPFQPKPHQVKAIDEAKKYFLEEKNDRGKLIFPCGAGKSLTGFWMTRELGANSVVVAVPSLSLVKQTLDVYLREIVAHKKNVKWLCICSDEGIGKGDDIAIRTENIGVPCVTDPEYIAQWLRDHRNEDKIIFTTYQSGRILAEVSKTLKYTFDLGIFDEAHKTVGADKKLFSHLLFDENISIRKRIFMTATERFYAGSKDDIISMDNEDIYGDAFTQMSFKEAIETGLLTDYKVITIDVKKSEIADFIRDNKLVELNGKWKKDTEARSLASMLALRKAMKLFPIRNAVSFHSSIEKAQRNKELQQFITDTYHYDPIDTYTVSGEMPTTKRNEIVREFADSQRSLITNARCLTEGVDVPNIDCIVFSDPRKSKVDIVQALGRALRKKDGKDWGYVILPVIYDDTTHEIDNENFQEILAIVRGLASNDERIIEYFKDKNDQKLNKQSKKEDQFQFEVFSEYIDAGELTSQLQIRLWEKLSRFNWMPFVEAREFVRKLGLKGQKDWRNYAKSDLKPFFIPTAPHVTYKSEGWNGYGDWLGTGNVASWLKEFWSFEEAREFVRNLGLRGESEWREYNKSDSRPSFIPASPKHQYPEKWKGFGDWLGTGNIATTKREYLPYEIALGFVNKLKLKNSNEWREYCKSGMKPDNLPSMPHRVYKEKGWSSWGKWLGNGAISLKEKGKKFLPYEEAKIFIQNLKIKGKKEWEEYCSSGKKPDFIPSNPQHTYKDSGWSGYGDWFGTKSIATYNRQYIPFSEAREFARSKGLKNQKEWFEFTSSRDFPDNIPKSPAMVYKEKGWISWMDFLGSKGRGGKTKTFRSFELAREFVHELNLSSYSDWRQYCKSGEKPADIPTAAQEIYKNLGWKGWTDFLGSVGKRVKPKKYLSFDEARKFAHSLNLKTRKEWEEYCKSGKKPSNIPYSGDVVYKNEGWVNWADWLGSGKISNRNRIYLSFEEARQYIRLLNLKSTSEWRRYCSSGKKPDNIPSNPNQVYDEWTDFGDWLGTNNIAPGKIKYRSFNQVKKYAQSKGIKSQKEWFQHCKTADKPIDIPVAVERIYKDKGWVNWPDFLGTLNK